MCLDCLVISNDKNENLQRRFDEEEVLRCLTRCATDKARGLMVAQWASLAVVGK